MNKSPSGVLRLRKGRPIIAITMGDAAGVGPELCLELLARKDAWQGAIPLVIGDYDVLKRVATKLSKPFIVQQLDTAPDYLEEPAVFDPPGSLAGNEVIPGINQEICGRAAAKYIEEAVKGCLAGRYAAMVTAPISKKALNMGGVDFPGHTEMLGHLTRCNNYAMLLYSPQISCAFVTSHQPLRSVADSLTTQRIVEVAQLAVSTIIAIRGRAPRLALLGLNPHAGESGLFGSEEHDIVAPARQELLRQGFDIEGPLPADTAFTPQALTRFGCHIALYHDQGGIPFKMLAFDTGVNVTMGLPLVRTSPDHGTAFDIAWQGRVDPRSFLAAYDLAVQMSSREVRVDESGLHKLELPMQKQI